MEDKVIEKTEEKIKQVIDEDINMNNIEYLYKLSKIKHMAKEDECMNNYGAYGRTPGYNAYGNYREGYSARGRDMKYRGEDELDRVRGEYGRYMESRNYGDGEESDKAFHYMIKSLEGFIRTIGEEAATPQQKQMLRETLQRSMM